MRPYNIEAVSPTTEPIVSGPADGNSILDSFNMRNEFVGRRPRPGGQFATAPSLSPGRDAAAGADVRKASTRVTARPQADVPSSTSSGSWGAGELFPRSHPGNNNGRQQHQSQQWPSPTHRAVPPSSASAMGNSIVSGSIHPHILELVERQQERERQKRAHDARRAKGKSPRQQPPPPRQQQQLQGNQDNGANNVIRGLHMNHVLSDQQHEQRNDDFVSNHPLSPPFGSSVFTPNDRSSQHGALPVSTLDEDGNVVIEGTFQNKGCVCQTADDVGFLFGCGTHPQDEVVYVYNTKSPKPSKPPVTERNLWRHQEEDNVNNVLFQIDKEYHAMRAHHERNMGSNAAARGNPHSELLRDPPPGAGGPPPRIGATSPSQGHYMVVREDDADGSRKGSCSISSLMDLILPGNGKEKRSGGHLNRALCELRMSPRKGYLEDYSDYPPDREDRDRRQSTSMLSKRRPRPVSVSESNDEDRSTSSFDRALAKFDFGKKGVAELQHQLKTMVKERFKNRDAPPESPKESRQETSPLASLEVSSSSFDDNDIGKSSSSEKEMHRLCKEQASLDQARKMLKLELEQHELKMHEQKMAAVNNDTCQYPPQYAGGVGMGFGGVGMGLGAAGGVPGMMGSSPISTAAMMGMSPMMLSPLTAHSTMATTPMMVANPGVHQPHMQQMNGMGMNGMGLWPQQQQVVPPSAMPVNTGMNAGMMGNNGVMGNAMMDNSGPIGAQQRAERILQQTARNSVAPPDAPSTMDKSMFSTEQSTMNKSPFRGGHSEGQFVDNVGAYPLRPKISPKSSSRARSPRSRPSPTYRANPPPRPGPAARNANNEEELTQSSQMLHDLKIKNALIRQDISRMKNVMVNKNSPMSGGANAAGGMVRAGPNSRPFPGYQPSPPRHDGPQSLHDRRSQRGGGE